MSSYRNVDVYYQLPSWDNRHQPIILAYYEDLENQSLLFIMSDLSIEERPYNDFLNLKKEKGQEKTKFTKSEILLRLCRLISETNLIPYAEMTDYEIADYSGAVHHPPVELQARPVVQISLDF